MAKRNSRNTAFASPHRTIISPRAATFAVLMLFGWCGLGTPPALAQDADGPTKKTTPPADQPTKKAIDQPTEQPDDRQDSNDDRKPSQDGKPSDESDRNADTPREDGDADSKTPDTESPDTETPPEEPQGVVVVEGQLIDSIGGGDAGVTVTVRWKGTDGKPGEIITTTKTDEFGDFRALAPKPVQGDVVVTFEKQMKKTLVKEVHLGDTEFPEYLAEQLEGNLALIGRVTDALTKKPISDAAVTLKASYSEYEVKTDAEGRFTVDGLSPGMGELIVQAEKYGREVQKVARIEEFGEVPIELKPERVIHLHIVDDDGVGIASVTVECYDEPRDDFRTVVTDEKGQAAMHGMHFDVTELGLRLTHEAYVSSQGFDRQIVTPQGETESTHELVMESAGSISGTVTDAATDKPLNGARVMTGAGYSDASPRDWSNYQGNFHIHGVRSGPNVVTVHLSGFAPELTTVDMTAGEVFPLDIKLSPAAALHGVVKNKDGDPVHGAMVEAVKWRGHATLGLRAMTDASGAFIIESAPHDEFEISVTGPRSGSVKAKVTPGGAPVELTLPDAPAGGATAAAMKPGDTAPTFQATTLDGKPIDLNDLKGKTVLLDFWATWCGPCVAELPYLFKVYERFGARKDFVMISVSLDYDEKALRKFLKQRQMSWLHVFGDDAQAAANEYGVEGIPSLFIIGPDGKVVISDVRGEAIAKAVEKALAPNSTD